MARRPRRMDYRYRFGGLGGGAAADQRHLQMPLDFVIDHAITHRTYGHGNHWYPMDVHAQLLEMFDGYDRIGRNELMVAQARVIERTGRGRHWTPAFCADVVGNQIGWGIHLGVLEEVPGDDGSRGWRLRAPRENWWERVPGGIRQIHGLPPEAQYRINKKKATLAKLRDTLDRKAAKALTFTVEERLASILKYDPDSPIPASWECFVGASLSAEFPRIDQARGFLAEVHHRFTRTEQKAWSYALTVEAGLACYRGQKRKALEDEAAAALAEDAAAFADL